MPCGPICPASDALCIAGFKTGWSLWPPTRASFPGRGQATQKNTLEASKGNQNQPYLIQLGKGLPTVFPPSFSRFCCPVFFLPPTVSDTVGYPQTGRQGGPPDINSPNVHVKSEKTWKNIGFTSFSSCFHHQVPSLSPTVSDTVGSAPPSRDGPGGIRASDPKAPSLNYLVVHPPGPPKIQNPESKIQNSKIQTFSAKIQTFSAGFRGFWISDFGFWSLR